MEQRERESIRSGIHFGNVIAVIISWTVNKSILWALLHGICGWLYVLYYCFAY